MKKIPGFTLIEVLLATMILVVAVSAILYTIIQGFNIQGTSKDFSLAMSAARAEIEKVRNQDFSSIATGTFIFDPNGEDDNLNGVLDLGEDENGNGILDSPFDGSGQIVISDAQLSAGGTITNLKNIRVVICWRQKDGRIIGEDNGQGDGIALDGILHADEKAAGNGDELMDSPCVVVSSIANKG